eukprot:298432-Prymnesium_polylepis.1
MYSASHVSAGERGRAWPCAIAVRPRVGGVGPAHVRPRGAEDHGRDIGHSSSRPSPGPEAASSGLVLL